MQPLDQIRAEAFTIIANGGAVHLFDIMWPDGKLQKEMWSRNAQVFREIRERLPWLGGESEAQVAVLYSQNTARWYGRDHMGERVLANLYGVARALLDSQIPFDVICGLDSDALMRYDVLVLPDAACLSEGECDRIRTFVKAGGGLVCSHDTSMLSENGAPRLAFGLSDVLGIEYEQADTAAYSRVYTRLQFNRPM